MPNYILEEKNSFNILGFGTELKSNYTHFAGLNKEKSNFWQAISDDGRLDALKSIAMNDYVFSVNEAVNNRLLHYAGVMTEEEASVPEKARVIQFPKGEYLIVKGEGKTFAELNNMLAAIAFGQVLSQAKNFAYVGGPNATVDMGQRNGLIHGEIWIPIVRK
jgi:predicted transcriptional regulator YdeE